MASLLTDSTEPFGFSQRNLKNWMGGNMNYHSLLDTMKENSVWAQTLFHNSKCYVAIFF